jgi:hypothetical protein
MTSSWGMSQGSKINLPSLQVGMHCRGFQLPAGICISHCSDVSFGPGYHTQHQQS